MSSNEPISRADAVRMRLQADSGLRLELLAAVARVFREHGYKLSGELLGSLTLAVPQELVGTSIEASAGAPSPTGPPQTGVGPPQTGVGPPQTGVGPPQTGVGPPQTGVGPPQTGTGPPQTGVGPPQVGPPQTGKKVGPPQTGKKLRAGKGAGRGSSAKKGKKSK